MHGTMTNLHDIFYYKPAIDSNQHYHAEIKETGMALARDKILNQN